MKHLLSNILISVLLISLCSFGYAIIPDPDPVWPPLTSYMPDYIPRDLTPLVSQQVVGSIGEALTLADSTSVTLEGTTGKVVIADTADTGGQFFYIEEDDRSSGIRVEWTGAAVERGDRVTVTGAMGKIGGHERCINATAVTVVSHDSFLPHPLAMNNKGVAGYQLNAYTPGISIISDTRPESSLGPYNKGLLVMVSGRVSSPDSTNHWFNILDGTTLRVKTNASVPLPFTGDYCVVTGVSSSSVNGAVVDPLVLARDDDDILVNPGTEMLSSPSDILPSVPGWAGIALPGVPYHGNSYSPTALSVLSTVLDCLPRYRQEGNTLYQNLARWDAVSEQYWSNTVTNGGVMYCGADGYMLHYDTAGTITYPAISERLPQTDRYIPLLGKNTCNMIGYPFTQPTDISTLHVTDGYKMLTLREACQDGRNWLNSIMFLFQSTDQSQYDVDLPEHWPGYDNTTLQPWHSYCNLSYYDPAHPAKYGFIIPSPVPSLEMKGGSLLELCQESVQFRARLMSGGYPVVGHPISFSTTGGVFSVNSQSSAQVQTDSSGIATVQLIRSATTHDSSAHVEASATIDGKPVSAVPIDVTIRNWALNLTLSPSGTAGHDVPITVTAKLTTDDAIPTTVSGRSVTLTTTQGTFANGLSTFMADTVDGEISTLLTVTNYPVTATVSGAATPCALNQTATDSEQVNIASYNVGWPMFMRDQHHTGCVPAFVNDTAGAGEDQTVNMRQVWTAEVPTMSNDRPRYQAEGFVPLPVGHNSDGANLVDHPIFDSSPVAEIWTSGATTYKRVFAGGFTGTYPSSTGRLYAFNFESGQQAWTYPATGDAPIGGIVSTPCIAQVGANMLVFFGCMDGKVYAVNAVSGQLAWTQPYDTQYKVLTSPTVSSTVSPTAPYDTLYTLYIGTEHNDLIALNASTGSLIFNTHLNSKVQNSITGTSSPMVVNRLASDYVIVGSDDGYVYKLYAAGHDSEGQIAATFPAREGENWAAIAGLPIESSPSYRDGVVYFGVSSNEGGPVYALNVDSFDWVWNSICTSEVRTTPALCSDGIYVGDETGRFLYGFVPPAQSHDYYRFFDMSGHVFASQALTTSLVYAGGDGNPDEYGTWHSYIYAFNRLSFDEPPGNKLRDPNGNEWDLGAKIGSSPAICYTDDGTRFRRWVFVTARNGILHAFSSRL